jgi:hypothetical protein
VEDFLDEPYTKELHDVLIDRLALLVVEAAKACFTSFDPGLIFRKSTSALSYLGSSIVPIWSVQPSSETTTSLTSLAGMKE